MHCYLIISLYIVNIIITRANEFKLSDSKVLLPRTSFLSINYTIKGSPNICHEWNSDTPEVIIITPIYDSGDSKCSQQAIITSVWQSNNKATATVIAKNIATGHSVKCDVIIDQISKLEIETRTLELYLHETPQALIARAYDEYGNTFSTLDGIPFEWLINSSGSNGDAQNALRFITWIESEYSTPTLIGSLEQQGLQGYMQLVSGLKTGGAEVQLTFRDEKIKSVIKSKPVRLLVMANAALSPQLAYLIPHTQLSYKIIVHSQGSSEEISMPNNQYRLQINNTDLAELDVKGSTITAKKYGQTEVTLMDTNIKESFRHPSSLLYIVEPGFLTFHISPNENQWVLQTERDNIYTITIRPYDFNSHPIFMSDNLRLQTTIPKEYFEVLQSSANGTYNVVKAIKEGKTSLKSKLKFILLPNKTELKLDTPVEGFQDLIIFPPISVLPKYVALPWYPNKKSIPGYLLTAIGGSGEYKWLAHDSHHKTTNLSVAVDHKGYIVPLRLGLTHVVAADQRNLKNKGFATVSVDSIHTLQFILDIVEVEVNNEIDLPILATNDKSYQISHCHWLPFNILSEDSSIIQIIKIVPVESSKNSEACALLRVRGLRPGFAKITISLETILPNKIIKDLLTSSITIGSFFPTKFLEPSAGSTTIAIRSNRLMNIINGPLPWLLDPSNYFYEMLEDSISKRTINKISLIEHRPNNKFRALLLKVQCLNVGEVNISIVIGNKPSLKNPKPIKSVGIAKIICTVPVRMKLVPELIVSNISADCPFRNTTDNQHITVDNKSPPSIQVVFTDKNGVQIERSESLIIKIEIKSLSKKSVKEIVRDVYPNVIYSSNNVDLPISSRFFITPYQIGVSTGEIEIIAKSNSCNDGKCPPFNLESRLHMQISKSMVVYPEKISLYQHEKVGAKFIIKFGSGYFIITTPNTDFLQINKIEKQVNSEEVLFEAIQTKVDFSQRSAIINIRDACFSSLDSEFENSKTVYIELVKPSKLQLFSLNRIQLGSQINVLLKIFDDTGREFPHDSLNMLPLTLYFNDNSNVISVNFLHSKDWILVPNEYSESSGFIFKVNGEKLGFDSIFVKLENTEITSNILKIEVFPPLKLVPKYTVLLEGAEIQLSSTGGPQNSHDLLHYSIIKNNTVKSKEAKIEFINGPNGLIKAIGYGEISVIIKVEVTDIDPTRNNKVVVLSEDEGRVGVVQIKSLAICSPTKNLLVENSMPLWITFTSSFNDLQHIPITGFSLTGLENTDMSFKWHLNPPQGVISKLENILEPTGINIGNKYLHSGMRLITLNPGKQTIEVSVSNIPKRWLSKDIKQSIPLVSKLNVAIIPKLEILHPISFVRSILVPPATRITLKSSLDSVASITYTLIPYQGDKASTKSKSKIHSGNILETNSNLSGNEVENFILHITSSQLVKLNTANEITANQTVALFFTVKHPTYSMISPYISSDSIFKNLQTAKRSNKYSNIFVLPLGGPFEFQITNHDELGTIFDISPDTNMFSYRLHRSDNIAITISSSDSFKKTISLKEISALNMDPKLSNIDSTSFSSKKILQFQGLSTGDNAIQLFYHDVFSDAPHLTDIICIPTGSVLEMKNFPQKFATEGSRVKFEAPFSGGYWYSSDGDVVAIDNVSGEAILKKRGSSNILYSLINNYPEVEKLQNKNVLISQELNVHGASKLSMKIFDGTSFSLDDICSDNDCIPMSFNYQSNSLVVAVFISASDLKEYEKERNYKFEKEFRLNYSEKLQSSIPLECDIDIDSIENSILNFQDIYKNLFRVSLLPLSTEFDNGLGIKQWGCLISPNFLNSVTRDQLVHFIYSLKSDLKIRVQSRLKNNDIKSTTISIPTVFGYVLLMNNTSRTNLVIKESGEVITAIQLALPISTKYLLEENKHIKLTVSSSRPNLLEVLAPREDVIDSGIWVYPLKAVVVDKIINEKVEVVIEFPLTKQRDVISLQIDIQGKSSAPKLLLPVDSGVEDLELSQLNWFSPVLAVLSTTIIAILIVMIVNHFIQPKLNDDRSLPSPVKDQNSSFSGGSFNASHLQTSPRYTQHIWNSFKPKKDYSQNINEYSTRSKRYQFYPNNPTFQDLNDGYKSNFQ